MPKHAFRKILLTGQNIFSGISEDESYVASRFQLSENLHPEIANCDLIARDYHLHSKTPSSPSHHDHHLHPHNHHLPHPYRHHLRGLESDREDGAVFPDETMPDPTTTPDAPKRERPRSKTMEQLMTISEGPEERGGEEGEKVSKE